MILTAVSLYLSITVNEMCTEVIFFPPPHMLYICITQNEVCTVLKQYWSLVLIFFICLLHGMSCVKCKSNNVLSPSPSLCCCCWMTWGGWGSVWPMGVSVVAGYIAAESQREGDGKEGERERERVA